MWEALSSRGPVGNYEAPLFGKYFYLIKMLMFQLPRSLLYIITKIRVGNINRDASRKEAIITNE